MADIPMIGTDWNDINKNIQSIFGNVKGIVNPNWQYQDAIKQLIVQDPSKAQQLANLGGDALANLFGKGQSTTTLAAMGPDLQTRAKQASNQQTIDFSPMMPDIVRGQLGLGTEASSRIENANANVAEQTQQFKIDTAKLEAALADKEAKVRFDALDNYENLKGIDKSGLVRRMYEDKLTPEDEVNLTRIMNTPGAAEAFKSSLLVFDKKMDRSLERMRIAKMGQDASGNMGLGFINFLKTRVDDTRNQMNQYRQLMKQFEPTTSELEMAKGDGSDSMTLAAKTKVANYQNYAKAMEDEENLLKDYNKELNNASSKFFGFGLGGNQQNAVNPQALTLALQAIQQGAKIEDLVKQSMITPQEAAVLGPMVAKLPANKPSGVGGAIQKPMTLEDVLAIGSTRTKAAEEKEKKSKQDTLNRYIKNTGKMDR